MAFKLRSGNGPLKFKSMGSSPVRNEKPVTTPPNMREHYGSYKDHVSDMENHGVEPYSVEDWYELNNDNIEKAHFPDNQFAADMDKFRNYRGWVGDAIREKDKIQEEEGTYEEFEFTGALGAKLIRDGIMTQEEVDARLEEQKKKDSEK